MSITVEDLRQRIKDRREQALKPRYIELGRGLKVILSHYHTLPTKNYQDLTCY